MYNFNDISAPISSRFYTSKPISFIFSERQKAEEDWLQREEEARIAFELKKQMEEKRQEQKEKLKV